MSLFWSDPAGNLWLLIWTMAPALAPFGPGLALAWWAARRGAIEAGRDGSAAPPGWRELVADRAPLDFVDPWGREVRLAPGCPPGRADGLARRAAAAEARPFRAKAAALAILGARLAVGASFVVLGSGLLLLDPGICWRGGLVHLAATAALGAAARAAGPGPGVLDGAAIGEFRACWPLGRA